MARPWPPSSRAMDLRIPLTAFGKPLATCHRWFWRFGRVVAWVCGGRPASPMGKIPREGPVVVIAPHLSFFDALFLHALLPRPSRFFTASFFVTKSALLSWVFYMGGVIPVERHRRDAAAVRRALRLLASGEVVTFFPEGGRTWTGVPNLPMAPAAKLLSGLRVPIYVATVDGSYDYWPRFDARPRARRVWVRITGSLVISHRHSRPRRGSGLLRPWWADVYAPGGRAAVVRVAEEIRSHFAAAAAGEPARLRLEHPGRLQAVTRVLCFCPECAAAGLACKGRTLECPSCGAMFLSGAEGRLRLIRPGPEPPGEVSLHGWFLRMLAHVNARAESQFCLEECVDAGEVLPGPAHAGTIPFVPARARLDSGGLRIRLASREISLPLNAVAEATMMGSETLEVAHPASGTVVYLRAPGGAFRILLAARAHLRLPFEALKL